MSITPKDIHKSHQVMIDFDRMNSSGSCSLICKECINHKGKYSGQGKQIQWLNYADVIALLETNIEHQGNWRYWYDCNMSIQADRLQAQKEKQDNINRAKIHRERQIKNTEIMFGVREPEYTGE
jgi:hypothetical protein